VNAAPGDWSRDFAVDTTQHKCGASSLRVKASTEAGTSGSMFEMLSVPATPGTFWTRFWVQSAIVMGGTDHNAFAWAATGDMPNDGPPMEFAEDVGIAFNVSDNDRWPAGYGRLSGGGTNNYMMPAMTWACVEVFYDIANKHLQLYVNSTQLIDATSYPASVTGTYNRFKFGFNSYHGPARVMWYDDVAVAPTRIGCN